MMITDNFSRYLALKKQARDIEAQIEELRPAMLECVREHRGRMMVDGYDFIVSHITTWKFSSEVVRMQDELLQRKRTERKDGIAQIKERKDVLVVRKHGEKPPAATLRDIRAEHPRAYEKWTPEEEEVLRTEFQQGQTIAAIAEHLQRKTGDIRARLVKQGLIDE